jgi:hypothetical protein
MLFLAIAIVRTFPVTVEPTEDPCKFLRRLWGPILGILVVMGYVMEYISFSCAVANFLDKHNPKVASNCIPGIGRGLLLTYICGLLCFVMHHWVLSIYVIDTRRLGQPKAHLPHCTIAVVYSLCTLLLLVPVVSTIRRMSFYQQRSLEAAIRLNFVPEILAVAIWLTLTFFVGRWDEHRRVEQRLIGSSVWAIWRQENTERVSG